MSRFPSSVRFEYDEAHSSNFTRGNWRKDFIVIHHWNDPSLKPQFGGVVSWFKNPSANVSIQYMVEAGRITQMIPESAMAWHAGNSTANRHGIGIELNPRQSDGDYETAAQLVAEIWGRRGKLPLRKHREFFGTACPGTWDVARIKRRAEQIYSGSSSAVSTPALEGEVMSAEEYAAAVWNDRGDDMVNDEASRRGWRFGKIHEYVLDARNAATSAAGDVLYNRDYDYVNDDPTSLRHQTAKSHQYSRNASIRALNAHQEAREANQKIDAVADAVAELVGQIDSNVRKALEDKLADIKTEAAQVNAAEVAAELEVTAKEED